MHESILEQERQQQQQIYQGTFKAPLKKRLLKTEGSPLLSEGIEPSGTQEMLLPPLGIQGNSPVIAATLEKRPRSNSEPSSLSASASFQSLFAGDSVTGGGPPASILDFDEDAFSTSASESSSLAYSNIGTGNPASSSAGPGYIDLDELVRLATNSVVIPSTALAADSNQSSALLDQSQEQPVVAASQRRRKGSLSRNFQHLSIIDPKTGTGYIELVPVDEAAPLHAPPSSGIRGRHRRSLGDDINANGVVRTEESESAEDERRRLHLESEHRRRDAIATALEQMRLEIEDITGPLRDLLGISIEDAVRASGRLESAFRADGSQLLLPLEEVDACIAEFEAGGIDGQALKPQKTKHQPSSLGDEPLTTEMLSKQSLLLVAIGIIRTLNARLGIPSPQ